MTPHSSSHTMRSESEISPNIKQKLFYWIIIRFAKELEQCQMFPVYHLFSLGFVCLRSNVKVAHTLRMHNMLGTSNTTP